MDPTKSLSPCASPAGQLSTPTPENLGRRMQVHIPQTLLNRAHRMRDESPPHTTIDALRRTGDDKFAANGGAYVPARPAAKPKPQQSVVKKRRPDPGLGRLSRWCRS